MFVDLLNVPALGVPALTDAVRKRWCERQPRILVGEDALEDDFHLADLFYATDEVPSRGMWKYYRAQMEAA